MFRIHRTVSRSPCLIVDAAAPDTFARHADGRAVANAGESVYEPFCAVPPLA